MKTAPERYSGPPDITGPRHLLVSPHGIQTSCGGVNRPQGGCLGAGILRSGPGGGGGVHSHGGAPAGWLDGLFHGKYENPMNIWMKSHEKYTPFQETIHEIMME